MESSPAPQSLVDRCAAYGLDGAAADRLATLAELSLGQEISATAVTDFNTAVDVHIADSLMGLEVEALRAAGSIADIGAGLGFPGLVIALALPEAQVTLIDSVRKKMEGAAKLAQAVALENVACTWGRAEEVSAVGSDARESFDVVTARALAGLAVLVEYAAPLLRVGGALVAWKGSPSDAELAQARAAAEQVGMALVSDLEVEPFTGSGRRRLIVVEKREPTPERFPRRPGVALKSPLGA